MGEQPAGQLVDAGGAAGARRVPVRVEHDVLDDQLRGVPEQAGQRGRALRAVEPVLLVDPDHGQPAPFRVERVAASGVLLLGGQQPLPGFQPLLGGYDLGKRHPNLRTLTGGFAPPLPYGLT